MTDADNEAVSFDLHAIETRLGMARFGKNAAVHVQLLLGKDVPDLILYTKTLQGALVHVAGQLDQMGADSNRALGLLVSAVEQAGGQLTLGAELMATARDYQLAMTPTDDGLTLRTVLLAAPQDEAPGDPGASEGAGDDGHAGGPTIDDAAAGDALLPPTPDRPRLLRES